MCAAADHELDMGTDSAATVGARKAGGKRRIDWRDALAVGIVLCGFALPLRGLLRYQGPPMEEGFMLVFPERLLQGDIPNRDFLHLYGPGSVWVLAAVYKILGTTLTVERLFGLLQNMGIVFAVFALARPWGRRLATTCALASLVIVIGPIGLTALAWNGAVALGTGGLAVTLAARRRYDQGDLSGADRLLLTGGVLAGSALLYRPDLIVAVALGFAAALWTLPRPRLVRFGVAFVAVCSLYLVHMAMAGPGNALQGMLLDPVFHLRGGRSLPVPPSWSHFDGWLQKAAGLRTPAWPLPALPAPKQVFIWFFILPLIALFNVAVGIWRVRSDRAAWRPRVLLAVGLFGLGMLPQALQRPDTAHLAWASCVPLALLPVALSEVLQRPLRRFARWLPAAVAGALVGVLLVGVIPFQTVRLYSDLAGQTFGHEVFGAPMSRNGRVFYYGSEDAAAAAQRLIDRLSTDSKPGEKLLVGPVDMRQTPYSDAFFYYLFPELPPATRYIEMDPGMANAADSGLAGEVASADWLILSNVWTGWEEPNDSTKFGPNEPNEVVQRDFCKVDSYLSADGSRVWFDLYRRCRGAG